MSKDTGNQFKDLEVDDHCFEAYSDKFMWKTNFDLELHSTHVLYKSCMGKLVMIATREELEGLLGKATKPITSAYWRTKIRKAIDDSKQVRLNENPYYKLLANLERLVK